MWEFSQNHQCLGSGETKPNKFVQEGSEFWLYKVLGLSQCWNKRTQPLNHNLSAANTVFPCDKVVLTLPQRKQCSILKIFPKSQESKESAHDTQTRAGIKTLKVNKWFKGQQCCKWIFKPGNYSSQGGTVVGRTVLTLHRRALTWLFTSEKKGSFSPPRREVQTSYVPSKRPLLQWKPHLHSTQSGT